MQCSAVGIESWLFFVVSSVGLVLFALAPRRFQRWLRTHRSSPMVRTAPESFFGEWGVWAIRTTGIIWALMWIVSGMGVYCFFHGPG